MTEQGASMPYPTPGDRETRIKLTTMAQVAAICTKCTLHTNRTKCVFGTRHSNADLMFGGEGPGPDEDVMGEPFVGRSGDLLNRIVGAMGTDRAQPGSTTSGAHSCEEGPRGS